MGKIFGKVICILLAAVSTAIALWSDRQRRSEAAKYQYLEAHLIESAVTSIGSLVMLRGDHPEKAEEYLQKNVQLIDEDLRCGKIQPTPSNTEKWATFVHLVEVGKMQKCMEKSESGP